MAIVSKILTYDDTDEAAILAAGVSGAVLYSAGPVAGAGIVDSSFMPYSYGTLDVSTNTRQADGIIDSLGAYFPTGIFDGSHLYNAYGILDSNSVFGGTSGILYPSGLDAVFAMSGILDAGANYRPTGILGNSGTAYLSGIVDVSGYDYQYGVLDAVSGYGNVRYEYGILYDNVGTPTYTGEGIIDGDAVYHQYGIYDYVDGYQASGIYEGYYHSTGIWDGFNYYAWNGNGIYEVSGGYQYQSASRGIWDGSTFYPNGIFDATETYRDYGIYAYNDGAPTWFADGIYDNCFDINQGQRYAGGIALRNQFDELVFNNWSGSGIYSANVLSGTTSYHATGVFDGNSRSEYGILHNSGGSPTYAFNGILDESYAWNQYGILRENFGDASYESIGLYHDSSYYGEGVIKSGNYYGLQVLDVLGGGLM